MANVAASVAGMLEDDETVERVVRDDPTEVVLTDSRVIVYTPDAEGPNYQEAKRPNVTGVEEGAVSDGPHLGRAAKLAVPAAVFLAMGRFVVLDGAVPRPDIGDGAAAVQGTDSILSILDAVRVVVNNFDEGMTALGALFAVGVAVSLVRYWLNRRDVVRIDVAGDEDLVFPRPEDDFVVRDVENLVEDARFNAAETEGQSNEPGDGP